MNSQHETRAPWTDGEIDISWYYEPGDESCGQAGGAVVEEVWDVSPPMPWWPDRIKRNVDELEALAIACTDDEPDADMAADLLREDTL